MRLPEEEKMSLEDVKARSKAMFDRFEGPRGLHAKVKWRLEHFYLDPRADPMMPGSSRDSDGRAVGRWQDAATQTTWVSDVFWKWQARQIENIWKVECKPMVGTIPNNAEANQAEAYLMQAVEFIRERTGIDVQSNLAFAKGIKGAGVLHWRVDSTIYDETPDYDEVEDEPADKERYEKTDKGYKETAESLTDRIARYKAECGPPLYFETLPMEQCAWTEDKTTYSQTAEFGVKRVISNLGEWKDMKRKDMALRERLAPVQDSQGMEEKWMPSSDDYKKTVTITEHWTRKYWYEWCEQEDYFDCGEHIYQMPPFALDVGRYTDVADTMWAYQPVFHSMLEEKPNYDRLNSLTNAAVEGTAIPIWVEQPQTSSGPPQLLTDGTDVADGLDSGSARTMPPGYRLEAVGGVGVNHQLLQMLEASRKAMEHAEPSTGFATFGATTQPTSAWQEQAQENMEPKSHIRNTARALQVMINNIIQCFASDDGPGEVFGYARDVDGRLDRNKVLSRKPEHWKNVLADVKIAEVGNVERGALEELGMVKLEKGLITPIEFIGDYEGKPNPELIFVQREAWKGYQNEVLGMQIRQAMAKAFGVEIALAPGALPMVNGQQVSDEEAIATRGGQPLSQTAQSRVPGADMMVNAAPSTEQSAGGMPQPQLAQATPGVF